MGLIMKMSFLAIMLVTYFALARSKRSIGGQRRMINGKQADLKDWTFLVRIKYLLPNNNWRVRVCSATLICRKVLVTAAHCVWKTKPEEILVYLPRRVKLKGSNEDYNWTTSSYSVYNISMHPDYNHYKTNGHGQNVAQIMLKESVPDYIKPIPVADVGDTLQNCVSAGWGTTKYENVNISKTLQEINVAFSPWSECKKYIAYMNKADESEENSKVFCGTGKNQTDCYGDAGSPLICDSPKGKVFSGIMLGGDNECTLGKGYIIFNDVRKQNFTKWL